MEDEEYCRSKFQKAEADKACPTMYVGLVHCCASLFALQSPFRRKLGIIV